MTTKPLKPTPAQRAMLANLWALGPDEYVATLKHPKPRSGRESVAEACADRGWVTIVRPRLCFRVITITDKGVAALDQSYR